MKYVAFFRGINVGGKNIVKMSELRQLFTDLGLQNVKTYIQSGNVIFSSDTEQCSLVTMIEKAFEEKFGFNTTFTIRSEDEITSIIDSLPFEAEEIEQARREAPDVEHIYVYLSDSDIDKEKVVQLCSRYNGSDRVEIEESEIYLLCFQSIRDSKLAIMLSKLPQPLTFRNLNTMKKISMMF